MGTLSTHVLDTSLGAPAQGIRVVLATRAGEPLGDGVTDADGRISSIGPDTLPSGDYRLTFETAGWFAGRSPSTDWFYPEVIVVFTIADPEQHYHVPVLLNPYGYATYRGS